MRKRKHEVMQTKDNGEPEVKPRTGSALRILRELGIDPPSNGKGLWWNRGKSFSTKMAEQVT